MIPHPPGLFLHNLKLSFLLPALIILPVFLLTSCSSSVRYSKEEEETRIEESAAAIRVLLNESENDFNYVVKNQLVIRDDSKKIALVKTGNTLQFVPDGTNIRLKIGNQEFEAPYFLIENDENTAATKYNGNSYTGIIKVLSSGNKINVINTLSLEEYLKGVLPVEMPVGKGAAYYECFKAFAICARTYAVNRMKEGKSLFDIYADTRDQVFGGSGKGNEISDKAVDETRGSILTYENQPAVIYYHSTCGGTTEAVNNVFGKEDLPYLRGITDGEIPYCSESPRYKWQEIYSRSLFIERLYKAKLIPDKNFELQTINIKKRFESGRINELTIVLADKQNKPLMVNLHGNSMRSVIRTADDKSILRSTAFDITLRGNTITIDGKGFGHGVGLCQWGAMYLAAHGKSSDEILSHYYPGTEITQLK
jgi:stage II sporulation protein D